MSFLKKVIFVFLLLPSSFANILECPKADGIKSCQKEAKEFCAGDNFTIKASSEKYSVHCDPSKTQPLEEEKISNKEEKSRDEKNVVSKPKIRLAFGLGFNTTGTAESDVRIVNLSNGATGIGSLEFDVESGISLNAEARILRKNGWGFSVGGDLDLIREVKSATVTAGGNTETISANEPGEWTALVLYGNLVYKWENFYIPFGLNVNAINYSEVGLDTTSTGVGAQLGIGFETESNFAFEIYSRALTFDFNYVDSNLDVYFEDGIMSDVTFRVKYILP